MRRDHNGRETFDNITGQNYKARPPAQRPPHVGETYVARTVSLYVYAIAAPDDLSERYGTAQVGKDYDQPKSRTHQNQYMLNFPK